MSDLPSKHAWLVFGKQPEVLEMWKLKVIPCHCGNKDKAAAWETHTGPCVLRKKFKTDAVQSSFFAAHTLFPCAKCFQNPDKTLCSMKHLRGQVIPDVSHP